MAALRSVLALVAISGCLSTPKPPAFDKDGGTGDGSDGSTAGTPCSDDASANFPFALVLDDPALTARDRLVRGGTCKGKPSLLVYDPVESTGDTFSIRTATPRLVVLPEMTPIGELRAIGTSRDGALVALVATNNTVSVYDVPLHPEGVPTLEIYGNAVLGTASPAWVAHTPTVSTGLVLFGAGTTYWRTAIDGTTVAVPGGKYDTTSLPVLTASYAFRPGAPDAYGWLMMGPVKDLWLEDGAGAVTIELSTTSNSTTRVVAPGGARRGSATAPLAIAVDASLAEYWVQTPGISRTDQVTNSPSVSVGAVGIGMSPSTPILAVMNGMDGRLGTVAFDVNTQVVGTDIAWIPPGAPLNGIVRVGQFDSGLPQVLVLDPDAGAALTPSNSACVRPDINAKTVTACAL